MKRYDCEQGSVEWGKLRVGRPTASQFHRIITPKTLKPSAAQDKYIYELLAEWITGSPQDDLFIEYMERGRNLEESAIADLELQRDVTVDRVGFCTDDKGLYGASPDGFIGDDEGLEIKCPKLDNHIGYLIGDPANDYKCQIQGGLWVCERDTWTRLVYNPVLPNSEVKLGRDEKFIAALSSIMDGFLEKLEKGRDRLKALGVTPIEVTQESVAKERSAA